MKRLLAGALLAIFLVPAVAQDVAPDVLVKTVTLEVVELIAKDKEIKAGSRAKLIQVIEAKVLPHFNFGAMTALANSLFRFGSGNGCFTSSAVPVGFVTTSRTAMNDV